MARVIAESSRALERYGSAGGAVITAVGELEAACREASRWLAAANPDGDAVSRSMGPVCERVLAVMRYFWHVTNVIAEDQAT